MLPPVEDTFILDKRRMKRPLPHPYNFSYFLLLEILYEICCHEIVQTATRRATKPSARICHRISKICVAQKVMILLFSFGKIVKNLQVKISCKKMEARE